MAWVIVSLKKDKIDFLTIGVKGLSKWLFSLTRHFSHKRITSNP